MPAFHWQETPDSYCQYPMHLQRERQREHKGGEENTFLSHNRTHKQLHTTRSGKVWETATYFVETKLSFFPPTPLDAVLLLLQGFHCTEGNLVIAIKLSRLQWYQEGRRDSQESLPGRSRLSLPGPDLPGSSGGACLSSPPPQREAVHVRSSS